MHKILEQPMQEDKTGPVLSRAPRSLEDRLLPLFREDEGAVKGEHGGIALRIRRPNGVSSILIEFETPPIPLTFVTCDDGGAKAAYRRLAAGASGNDEVLLDRFDVIWNAHPEDAEYSHFWSDGPAKSDEEIVAKARTLRDAMCSIIWAADTLEAEGYAIEQKRRVLSESVLEPALSTVLTADALESFLRTSTESGEDDHGRQRTHFDAKGCAASMADWLAQEVAEALHPVPSSSFADDVLSQLDAAKTGLKAAGGAQ